MKIELFENKQVNDLIRLQIENPDHELTDESVQEIIENLSAYTYSLIKSYHIPETRVKLYLGKTAWEKIFGID